MSLVRQTILNCFKKSGFGQHSVWNEEHVCHDFNDNENVLKYNYEPWLNLNEVESISCTVHNSLDTDNELISSEFPTDEDIVKRNGLISFTWIA